MNRRTSLFAWHSVAACCICVVAALPVILLAGCAADRKLNVTLPDSVERPDQAALVFFVDSLGKAEFDGLLAAGKLPNVQRHLVDRGVSVERAVTCIPSITYAVSVTFITGQYPGHHGIVSNKWYEPSTGRFQNYCSMYTYQRVDGDYDATPTLYDVLDDRCSVSIQTAIRRGVFHNIDNWATSGINWFFDNKIGVDCLVAQRLELIAERSQTWGRWPELIWAYFPATDENGHRFGPDSPQRLKTIMNADRQIGRMCESLQDIGMYDKTCLVLVSDHGMQAVSRSEYFDISDHLCRSTGARIWSNGSIEAGGSPDLRRDYDYAVATTASRWCAVYPLPNVMNDPSNETARLPTALASLEASLAPGQPPVPPHDALPQWIQAAINHPAVELAAISFAPNRVHVFTRQGHAFIERTANPERHIVRQFADSEVLQQAAFATNPGPSDSRTWLERTANDRYPDFVPQIAAYFDHERAGNIVFFAAEGWDFSREDPCGGHGSILATDMLVPMVFAGPGVSRSVTIPYARNTDVMPTILHLLDVPLRLEDGTGVDIDGVNLLPSSKLLSAN